MHSNTTTMSQNATLVLITARDLLKEKQWRPVMPGPELPFSSGAVSIIEAVSQAARSRARNTWEVQELIEAACFELGATIIQKHRLRPPVASSYTNLIEHFSAQKSTTFQRVMEIFPPAFDVAAVC